MDFVKKYRELKKKHGVQLGKELSRRGMTSCCHTDDEIACDIVAYDAYYAGRSDGLAEARKERKNMTEATAKERFNIVLKDNANDTVAFLKVTERQMDMLDYLIDNDWLTDVSYTKTEQIGWDEP